MSDFWKGTCVWVMGMLTAMAIFSYLGTAWTYNDNWKAGLMQSCEQNGYTWGECYNVLHGRKDSFDK